jgi:hypothetical protein
MIYTFSFYAQIGVNVTINPPWWKFWAKPRQEHRKEWQRFSLPISETEKNAMLANQEAVYDMIRRVLVQHDIHGDVKQLQIEENHATTEYVPTSFVGEKK